LSSWAAAKDLCPQQTHVGLAGIPSLGVIPDSSHQEAILFPALSSWGSAKDLYPAATQHIETLRLSVISAGGKWTSIFFLAPDQDWDKTGKNRPFTSNTVPATRTKRRLPTTGEEDGCPMTNVGHDGKPMLKNPLESPFVKRETCFRVAVASHDNRFSA
jgi:hypothetical protein